MTLTPRSKTERFTDKSNHPVSIQPLSTSLSQACSQKQLSASSLAKQPGPSSEQASRDRKRWKKRDESARAPPRDPPIQRKETREKRKEEKSISRRCVLLEETRERAEWHATHRSSADPRSSGVQQWRSRRSVASREHTAHREPFSPPREPSRTDFIHFKFNSERRVLSPVRHCLSSFLSFLFYFYFYFSLSFHCKILV